MNRTVITFALGTSAMGCTPAVSNNPGSPSVATESSLMQADRDFAVATHARGIDGWMSFYAPDAIRIRYRGNMVKGFDDRQQKTPYPFGYGAATGGPPVLTSSTSSYHRGPERKPVLIYLDSPYGKRV